MVSRSRRFALTSFLGLLVAGFVGCGAEEETPEPVVRPVKILELSGGGASQMLEFPGTVRAGQHAEMAFEVAGRIEELPVTEGQAVEKGDLLARLDPRDYQSKLDAEIAKERAALAELERTRALFEENVTSQQQLDTKQRNYDVTKTNVERARKAVEDARLLAPFSGIVARIDVENFANVQAKQVLLVVENAANFEVEANIPEQDAARMPPQLSLAERTERVNPEVELTAVDGRTFPAQFTELSTTADPKTRTFAATFSFENPGDIGVATGMTATVRVHVPDELVGETGLLIPSVAVGANPAGEPIVWVIDPTSMQASARRVEIGTMTGDRVRVQSGLDGREWIAISGVAFLAEGMTVSRAAN